MITSKQCWMIDTCSKFKSDNSCQLLDIYCPKLFKLDKLYEYSLLSNQQRKKITLRIK